MSKPSTRPYMLVQSEVCGLHEVHAAIEGAFALFPRLGIVQDTPEPGLHAMDLESSQ